MFSMKDWPNFSVQGFHDLSSKPLDKNVFFIYLLGIKGVLVSAGTELTLFLVAGTVPCFGFSVRIMLITH